MSLNGARLRYVDENGQEVLVPAKGRTFQIGSYFSCDLILEPQAERLICEIKCDAFGRVTIHNQSTKETTIHLNDKIIHGQRGHPLLPGNRITILDRVYTWECHKVSGSEDVPGTPERLSPIEQAPNSCPSLKSHRPQLDKRLTVHNFRYSINSDDEGNTSIESRGHNESHLEAEEESLNFSTPPSTELTSCETPKVDLVEATQNKENTATPPATHQQLLQLCALSDVVITSFSPRETGVKVEKSFTCVRKPTKMGKQAATSVTMSTPKSVYSTPKGGVLSELNDDSCSRDLVDFTTPSTSKKTKRESSMYLIDLTTPSKLRPSFKQQLPTPISVDSTDESSEGSPFVIDITKSDTPPTPSRSHLAKTPRRPVAGDAATPTRTPRSLMKLALLTSTKKKLIAANQKDRTPVATPKTRPDLQEARRLSRTSPRLPFASALSGIRAAQPERGQAPNTTPRKRQSLHLGTPRDNKLSQIRKSLAAAKRSPTVDLGNRLKAKARRTLNSPKSGSPKSASPAPRKTINLSQAKCSTPEKLNESSTKDDLSRTFTIMNESGDPEEGGSVLGMIAALVTGEMDDRSVASKVLDTSHPSKDIKEQSLAQDQPSKSLETKEKVASPNKEAAKLDEIGTKAMEGAVEDQKELELDPKESLENSPIEANENIIIEDSICEEIHANIPKPIDDDAKEVPSDIKSSDSVAEAENQEPDSRVETPKIRRSLRRLSVDQKAGVATTPRRRSSSRRASVEASSSSKTEDSKMGTRRASCSALDSGAQAVAGTPRRKRRFTEEMGTPTRQSKRLMTPKRALPVDESIGDMGVIVEEDDDAPPAIVEDENYGKELPSDEPDNVNYQGLRDLLKTPKNCSTPRFKGLREMMRTPKVAASPIFGNIEELLDNSMGSTPHRNKASRSITVAHVAVEEGKALDGVLKTPSARNIMVPIEPASAVLKSRGDSLAATTEYDLEMTNTTLHLDQIFDDVPSTSVAHMEDTEAEINVTALSTASALDPLRESVSSEAPMSVSKPAATDKDSHKNDPLTSTTYKAAMQADLELSTTFTEEVEATSRASSPGSNEMSGMQLLDQTSDSMFSEPLMVSGVESCKDVTIDETRALGQTTCPPLEVNEIDTDSNVGLTEPLVFSDDEEDTEAGVTPKKSTDHNEVSIAYQLEASSSSNGKKKLMPGEEQSVNESSALDESKTRENDSLLEEVSIIEVDKSVPDDSINATNDGISLIIELDSSSDTEEPPAKENNESAAGEVTIVESETFPLDSTEDMEELSTSVDQKPVESGLPISEDAKIGTEDPTHPLATEVKETLPTEEEVAEKSISADVASTDNGKENDEESKDVPVDLTAEEEVDQKRKQSIEEDSVGKLAEEDQPVIDALSSKELTEEKATANNVSLAVQSQTFPLDSTADSSMETELSFNVVPKPDTKEDLADKTAEEDHPAIDALPSEELAEEKTTGDDTAVDADDFPLDSTAETSVIVEEAKADQKPIDLELPRQPAEEDLPAADFAEEETTEEVVASTDELPIDATTPDAVTDNTTVESLGQDVEPNQIITKPDVGEVSPASEVSPVEAEKPKQSDVKQHTADAEPLDLDTEAEPSTAEVPLVETEEAKKGDVEDDDTNAETFCLDETPILNESITKPEIEVSLPIDPKLEVEPSSEATSVETEEAKEEDTKNDDTSEELKTEAEQSTLVEAKEPEKGDVEEVSSFATETSEGFVPETPTPNTQDVELASPADETAPKDKASPGPSPATVEGDDIIPEIIPATLEGDIIIPQTSAAQDLVNSDTVPIDLAQEQQSSIQENSIKEDATETEIVPDKNPSEEQQSNGVRAETPATEDTSKLNEADKTQEESVCEAESDMEETTTEQLPLEEPVPVTAAVESPLNELVPPEESNATDITTGDDQQERDVRAPEDSVVTVILDDDSTSMETTQNESCGKEPASPNIVPPTDDKADEQTPLDSAAIEVDSSFCSLIEESFTEQPKEDVSDSKEKEENTPNQDESEDEVIQLDASSIVEDVAEDSVIEETPKAKSFVNDQEVEEVESKPTEETSAQLRESNEDGVISIDNSPKESLEEETAYSSPPLTAESSFAYNLDASQDDSVSEQKPDEVATEAISREEPISDVLESSAALEALSSSAVQDTNVVENPEISTSGALNSSKDIEDEDDGAREAGASEEPLIKTTEEDATETVTAHESSRDAESAKEKPQKDESTSIAAESEDKSQDQNAREVEELDKAAQEIPLPSLTKEVALIELESATNVAAKSITKTIEEEALDTAIHQSVSEIMSEVLTEETAAQATESNTNIEEQTESDDHNMEAKSQAQKAILAAAVEDADVIELSDDSESESPPGKNTPVEEDITATVPASEAVTSLQVIETLTTEDPKEGKVEDVPEDLSLELLKVESAVTSVINPEEDHAENPQISERCASVESESEAVERTAVTESDAKAQDKSVVEGSADEETPASEKDKSRGVEADSEHLPEVEASKKKASNCEDDEASKKEASNTQDVEPSEKQTHNSEDSLNEKLAAPYVVSSESETSEILKNSGPEPSVSPKHSTMNASSPSACQPLPHEDVSSEKDKEEFKPVKRATRKGSASVESPAEDFLEKPSRRARKPSAEVEEIKLNDVQEKPKRRAASRKPSAEVAESIEETKETKEEEVLNVIPEEEPHSSRPNQDKELQEKADTHPTPEADVLEKPRRRARKPSEEVKSAEITEKPKRRARKPSAEPMLPIQKEIEAEVEPKEEEKAHSSKINTENELQKEAETSQKEEDHAPTRPRHRGRQPSAEEETLTEKRTRRGHMHPEEHLEEEKEITEESNEQNEPPKQDEEKMLAETRQEEIIKSHTEKPKRRGRKASTDETETTSVKKPKINDPISEEDAPKFNQDEQQPEKPKRRARKASADEDANSVVKKPSSEEVLQSIVEEENEAISTVDEAPENVPTEGRSRRRGRKPSREEVVVVGAIPEPLENPLTAVPEDQSTNPTEQNGPQKPVPAAEVEEAAKEADPIERPRRRGRQPSVDTEHVPQDVPDKPRRRGRTPANHEKPPSEDEPDKKTRRTARKPSAEPVEAPAAEAEQHLKDIEEVAEPETEPEAASKQLPEEEEEEPKTRRRARKPVPAKKETTEEAPTRRRGRKATEDEAPKSEASAETKTSIEEEQPKEVPEDEVQELPAEVAAETPVAAPEKKPSAEPVEASADEAEQNLKDIEEVAEPETETEAASKQLPEEEEEPKTRRRARKPVPAKKDTPEEAPTRRRGRKATEDEAPKSEASVETKTSIEEEQPKEVPEDEVQELPADVAAETPVAAPEKKSTRRVRKASANVDEGTKAAAAKKAPIRRGRKEEDLVTDEDVQETQIDLQQVATESVPAVVVRSGSVALGASEDDLTPRRREGRNMPRKNYDETSDEDKQRSARRARKPVASRLLGLKAPEEEAATPPPKRQPVEEVDTPANTVPTPEPSTSQRREGRNVPRKNYTEAPDDDKPSTSRSRRMRNLTAKALELIVDSSPRPNTPRGRKGKAAVEDETPAKAAPPPPAQAESGAEEEPAPAPVVAKGRGARRKADDDLVESGMAAPPPSKRGARGQTEETEEQPPEAAKPAKKNARATARKAKVESESESEPVPAKKARGGARAKTPVEKSATEQEEHPPPMKKGRGGARAKTPVAVVPDESATEPEEEPAKKPAARSRARGAKAAAAVPEPEQPAAAQDSDAEAASSSSTSASRGGRAKKVHFEPTQTAATTVDASAEDAPKRATRSRRK